MDASQLKKLSESYATIAEGGKHEKSAMDWNKKDDNPEGKKVDKKKVDKCTCESFYLKRLKAMNPVMAEKYLAIAAILIDEGYESSRLIDNLVEALPKEIVGEDFRAALKAVNPRIYENLDTAEKRQARAILESAAGMSSGRQMTAAQNAQANSVRDRVASLAQRIGNFFNPPRSQSADPVVRAGGSYTAFGGGPKMPATSQGVGADRRAARGSSYQAPASTAPAATSPTSPQPTPIKVEPYTAPAGSTAPARPTPTPAQTPKTNRDGSNVTRTAPNAAGLTPMQQWAKNFPSLAAKVKPGASGSKEIAALKNSHEPEGDLVEDGAYIPSRIDDFNSDADRLKRMGKPAGSRIPSPGGGGQYDKTPRYRTGAMRLAKGKKTTQVAHFEPQGELVDEGSMKQARKNVGASTCWDGYKAKGTKKKNGRDVPNCVKEEETVDESLQKAVDNLTKKAQGGLESMGVKINRTSRPTMTKQQHDAKIKSSPSYKKEEVDAVDEGLKQARKNVGADTCWDGYKAKGTKKKNGREVPNCVKEEDITEKKGLWDNIHAKRKRGEKPAKPGDKDYPKTLNVEGVMSKDKEDHDTGGFRISDKKAKEAKERVKEKTKKKRAEYDNRYSDNTGEESKKKKEALEKKRGMKLDDHPQFTRDDYNVYDIILTYLDENNLMESVEEAEEIMMQLTGAQIVEIIDEFMNVEEQTTGRIKATGHQGPTVRMTATGKEPPGDRILRGLRDFVMGSPKGGNKLQSTTVQQRKPLKSTPKN